MDITTYEMRAHTAGGSTAVEGISKFSHATKWAQGRSMDQDDPATCEVIAVTGDERLTVATFVDGTRC